jgi:transcription elongation GreA/GreB family factor
MSRAFVKELDDKLDEIDLPERPQSEHINYMTLHGLEQMKLLLEDLRRQHAKLKEQEDKLSVKNQIKPLEAEIRYYEKRIQRAIPINISTQSTEDIRFGATVELVNGEDERYSFMIVGEDEADAERGLISWITPLARALIAKQAGDCVIWQRPAGDMELEVLSFGYKNIE